MELSKIDVSVVIPVYNEERRIKSTLEKIISYFKFRKITYEIIVVNDRSVDKTVDVVSSFFKKGVRLIQNNSKKGKGASVRKGMIESKGRIVMFSDADLSTPITEFSKLVQYIDEGYHVVIGSRAIKGANVVKPQPFYRIIMARFFNFLVNLFVIKGIKDTQCGFKMFKKNAVKNIFRKQKLTGFSFDVEVLYLARMNGYLVKEVPIKWINDEASKVSPLKDSIKMFSDVIKIRKMYGGRVLRI